MENVYAFMQTYKSSKVQMHNNLIEGFECQDSWSFMHENGVVSFVMDA
jgi:hypothetical protein